MAAYAVLADLTKYGLTSASLGTLTSPQQQAALDAANALADSYLGARFKLPLSAWGADLVDHVVAVASWRLMALRGFDPESATDRELRMSYEDTIRWFEGISAGRVVPVVTDSTANSTTPGGPFVQEGGGVSGGAFVVNRPTPRGW